jgi:hypothetical protein
VSCNFSIADYVCQCLVNGAIVGSCNEQALNCDLQQSCCAALLP